MFCPPYVLRWVDGLCYWVLLSRDGSVCMRQSNQGFISEQDAEANFIWWHAT